MVPAYSSQEYLGTAGRGGTSYFTKHNCYTSRSMGLVWEGEGLVESTGREGEWLIESTGRGRGW